MIADKIKNARTIKKFTQEQVAEIERDMKVAKAENNVIKFAWLSIVIGVVMIILGNVFENNPFIDFISAALPWVLLGLMVLFAILYLNKENDN